MVKRKPTKLKNWDFVKDKKYLLNNLREFDDPKDYMYQFDGHYYYPAVYKKDFDMLSK